MEGSDSLLPQVGGVNIQQVGGGLSTVQQGGSESLLPQAGGVTITPVQGGGGKCLSGKCKPYGWYSMPLLLPVSLQGVPTAEAKDLKALSKFWSIRSDLSDIIVANIDILKSTVYIVAPLRGDVTATNDILSWAFSMVTDPNSYIVFNGSLRAGGSEKDGDTIEGMVCYLMSRYPGQVLCVGCKDSGASVCPVDGIILHALPHTSRRLFLGSIPNPRSVDESHEKEMGGIRFEIMEVDTRFKKQHTDDMFSLTFKKPTALYNRDKEPKSQDIRADKVWGAPPGWVTRIEFQTRGPVQKGGRGGGRSVSGPDQGYSKEYLKMQEDMKTAKPCNPDEDWNCPRESPGAQRWMREEGDRQAKQMKEMMQLTDPAFLLGSAFKTLKSITKPKVPTPPEVPSPPHVPGTAEPLEKQLCEAITKIIHENKQESKNQVGGRDERLSGGAALGATGAPTVAAGAGAPPTPPTAAGAPTAAAGTAAAPPPSAAAPPPSAAAAGAPTAAAGAPTAAGASAGAATAGAPASAGATAAGAPTAAAGAAAGAATAGAPTGAAGTTARLMPLKPSGPKPAAAGASAPTGAPPPIQPPTTRTTARQTPSKPLGPKPAAADTIVIITPKGSFTIGNPNNQNVQQHWHNGQFTRGEEEYFEKNGFKLPTDQLTHLLTSATCDTEGAREMDPKCESRRSFAAYAYALKLAGIQAGNQSRVSTATGYGQSSERTAMAKGAMAMGAIGAMGAVAGRPPPGTAGLSARLPPGTAGLSARLPPPAPVPLQAPILNEKPRVKSSYRLLTDAATLLKAVDSGDLQKVLVVLTKTVNINTQNTFNKKTPLMIACENGYSDIVAELIKKTALDKHETLIVSGLTALGFACTSKYKNSSICIDKILEYQLKPAIDINLSTKDSKTYLMLAASAKNGGAIISLLSHKEFNLEINKQTPPLQGGITGLLKDKNGERTALMYAVESGCIECINHLLENGADPNIQSQNGTTALMMACVAPIKMDVINALIPSLVPVSAATGPLTGPVTSPVRLWGAKPSGPRPEVRSLQSRGARTTVNVNLIKDDCKTALLLACDLNATGCIMRLLEYGADLALTDTKLFTPLMILSKHGNLAVVKIFILLLNPSYDGPYKQAQQNTFATLQTNTGKNDNLQLEYINYKTDDNYSAISLAHQNKHEDVAVELSKYGATPSGRKWSNSFKRGMKKNCTRKIRSAGAGATVASAAGAGAAGAAGGPAGASAGASAGTPPLNLPSLSHSIATVPVTSGATAAAAAAGAAGTGLAAGAAGASAAAGLAAGAAGASAGASAAGAAAAAAPTLPGTLPPPNLPESSHSTQTVPVNPTASTSSAAPTAAPTINKGGTRRKNKR